MFVVNFSKQERYGEDASDSFLAQRCACQPPQCGRTIRADRRGGYVLRLTPGGECLRDDRATFVRHSDDTRAGVVLGGSNFHPGRVLDQREIARQRRALRAKRLGQLADGHIAPQEQHHQNGELRRAQSVRAKLPVEGARDPARRPPRGEAEAIRAFGQVRFSTYH
jgi:hypothetical protein